MIKLILKGVMMGVANIIPGVSGGTMAVSMGIYDKIIHAATHLVSEFKKSMKLLLPIVLGMALGIVVLARILEYMFARVPLQTNLLFIGLIIGGLPAITKKVKGKTIRGGHILVCLLFFGVVAGLAMMGEQEGAAADLSFHLINIVKLFGVGIVASATMVIPGVSGSMMLMLMGYYNPILNEVNDFIDNLVQFNVPGILDGCKVLVPFGIGVVVGIFAIAKIIEIIFEKFPDYAYWAIIGLIVASPVAIFFMGSMGTITIVSVLTGAVALLLGVFIALKLGEE
jgi:putative membrane protein